MNILLINPTGGPIVEYGALAKATPSLPQLGLASIAAVLKNRGHNVKIIDLYVETAGINDIISIVKAGEYSVVGFSVYITTIKNTFKFAQVIKNSSPNVLICVGGPQVTLFPDFFTQPFIDYIFIGEADFTFADFIESLQKEEPRPKDEVSSQKGKFIQMSPFRRLPDKIDPAQIRGCLKNNNGKLLGNRELSLIEDLNALSFLELDSFFDLSKFYPPAQVRGNKAINVLSVRGCPYQCTFCAAGTITGRRLRMMSVNRFVDYLELMASKGFDSFMMYDDTFTINKKRAVQISEEIIKRGIKIVWNCWSRADCVDLETLSAMRQAGCYLIMYGFESFNDKTLKRIRKGFTVEQCLKSIDVTKKAGMVASASFMLGLPGESRKDIINTINLASKTKLDIGIFGIFEPYEGTPIYADCQTSGRWIKSKYKNRLLLDQEEVWVPHGLEREELEKLARWAYSRFYLRASYFKSLVNILWHLSWKRRIRLIWTGLDYFIFQRLNSTAKSFTKGSRYR